MKIEKSVKITFRDHMMFHLTQSELRELLQGLYQECKTEYLAIMAENWSVHGADCGGSTHREEYGTPFDMVGTCVREPRIT